MKTSFLLLVLTSLFLTILMLPQPALAQCVNSPLNEGLISALSKTGGGTIGNTDTTCVLDPQAAYRDFKVPSYNELEDQFYTLSPSTAKRTDPLPGGTLNFLGDGIYLQPGNLTVTSALGSGVQIIFIRGNLTISGNINYADTDAYSGLVFIVQGDININRSVTKVNAVLISSGTICTAHTGAACEPVNTTNYTSQLEINGSLISLNKTDLAAGTSSILLRRNLLSNTAPAELIKKQPKYLYILRNGLLTKDLILTQEDRNYEITPDPGGGPAPTATPAPVCPNSRDPLSIPASPTAPVWVAVSNCVISIFSGL